MDTPCAEDPMIRIRAAAYEKDFIALRKLLRNYSELERKEDGIYDMLQKGFGYLDSEVYRIAFETEHLSMYLSVDIEVYRNTGETVYGIFESLGCGGKGTTPEEICTFETNVMGTIDVMFENFVSGYDLRSFAWIVWSRGQFIDSKLRYYPDDLPSIFGTNVMNQIMGSFLNPTDEFVQKIFLKFFDQKVPLPDWHPEWICDTQKPISPFNYLEVLHLFTPIQYIVRMGWLYALKGLYERIPEKVKKDLSDGAVQHIQAFRDKITTWKKTRTGYRVECDPVTGESCEISLGSKYEVYHNNGDAILEELEKFVQEITK